MFQHSLGRLYIDVMGLGKKSDAANILMNYKNPAAAAAASSSFSSKVQYILLPTTCTDTLDVDT